MTVEVQPLIALLANKREITANPTIRTWDLANTQDRKVSFLTFLPNASLNASNYTSWGLFSGCRLNRQEDGIITNLEDGD